MPGMNVQRMQTLERFRGMSISAKNIKIREDASDIEKALNYELPKIHKNDLKYVEHVDYNCCKFSNNYP